jgi:hypothetical protein
MTYNQERKLILRFSPREIIKRDQIAVISEFDNEDFKTLSDEDTARERIKPSLSK